MLAMRKQSTTDSLACTVFGNRRIAQIQQQGCVACRPLQASELEHNKLQIPRGLQTNSATQKHKKRPERGYNKTHLARTPSSSSVSSATWTSALSAYACKQRDIVVCVHEPWEHTPSAHADIGVLINTALQSSAPIKTPYNMHRFDCRSITCAALSIYRSAGIGNDECNDAIRVNMHDIHSYKQAVTT